MDSSAVLPESSIGSSSRWGEAATAWIVEHVWKAGHHITGSRTFQDMAAYRPFSTQPYAPPMNAIPKVFSRRGVAAGATRALEDATRNQMERGEGTAWAPAALVEEWARSRVAAGELAAEIAALKREPGNEILAHHGAQFARSLVRSGLVDEYRLLVHPVVLGRGLPLFSKLPKPLDLTLSARRHSRPEIAQIYRPNSVV